MVKVILPEANCLLIPIVGYYHMGNGVIQSKEWVFAYHSDQTDSTKFEIIILKDKSLQPKGYI